MLITFKFKKINLEHSSCRYKNERKTKGKHKNNIWILLVVVLVAVYAIRFKKAMYLKESFHFSRLPGASGFAVHRDMYIVQCGSLNLSLK